MAGKTIALVGDLKHGRTTHSLARLLCLFEGVKIVYVSPGALLCFGVGWVLSGGVVALGSTDVGWLDPRSRSQTPMHTRTPHDRVAGHAGRDQVVRGAEGRAAGGVLPPRRGGTSVTMSVLGVGGRDGWNKYCGRPAPP